jgi:hypothetical protein
VEANEASTEHTEHKAGKRATGLARLLVVPAIDVTDARSSDRESRRTFCRSQNQRVAGE